MATMQPAKLNVDVIEAGYPASSPEDFDAVNKSTALRLNPAVLLYVDLLN